MHADRLLWSIRVQSLVSTTQAFSLLQSGQIEATERYTHAGGYTAGVVKYDLSGQKSTLTRWGSWGS